MDPDSSQCLPVPGPELTGTNWRHGVISANECQHMRLPTWLWSLRPSVHGPEQSATGYPVVAGVLDKKSLPSQ